MEGTHERRTAAAGRSTDEETLPSTGRRCGHLVGKRRIPGGVHGRRKPESVDEQHGDVLSVALGIPAKLLPSPTPTTTPPLGGTISIFTWDGDEGADVLKDWYAKNNLTLQSKPVTNENIGAFLKSPRPGLRRLNHEPE